VARAYDDRTVGMRVNAEPEDTPDEVARIGLARDESGYPGEWSAIPRTTAV
jgi:hypothetical protein